MRKLSLAIALLLAGMAFSFRPAYAGAAGASTAVACGAASTQILTAGDLGAGVPRHWLLVCNNGPGFGYVAFGTSNAATITNGIPLGPLQCLPEMQSTFSPNGVVSFPTQLDVACIADGAAVPNMVALDW